MPRYYFHLSRGEERITDDQGIELQPEQVRTQALLQILQDLRMTERPDLVEEWRGWSLEITDAAGQVVRIIPI